MSAEKEFKLAKGWAEYCDPEDPECLAWDEWDELELHRWDVDIDIDDPKTMMKIVLKQLLIRNDNDSSSDFDDYETIEPETITN